MLIPRGFRIIAQRIPAGMNYVCQVPELLRHTQDVSRFGVSPARRPVTDQQAFDILFFFSPVKDILIVCEFMVNPGASILESQTVLFFGGRIGVAPALPSPNKGT